MGKCSRFDAVAIHEQNVAQAGTDADCNRSRHSHPDKWRRQGLRDGIHKRKRRISSRIDGAADIQALKRLVREILKTRREGVVLNVACAVLARIAESAF